MPASTCLQLHRGGGQGQMGSRVDKWEPTSYCTRMHAYLHVCMCAVDSRLRRSLKVSEYGQLTASPSVVREAETPRPCVESKLQVE